MNTIVPFITTFIIAGAVIYASYKAVQWWDLRSYREWIEKESPSNLDKLDKPDELMP